MGGGREVLADASLLTQDAVPAQDAALTPPDAELERVTASLNAGADPLVELDPTAAGLGGGSGGDGHGFVRLLRISEGVDPLSFQDERPDRDRHGRAADAFSHHHRRQRGAGSSPTVGDPA